MVGIKIWDEEEIDISSSVIKEKLIQSISTYLLEHWNDCVKISSTKSDNKYITEFLITL